jgi:hypothetical protein
MWKAISSSSARSTPDGRNTFARRDIQDMHCL